VHQVSKSKANTEEHIKATEKPVRAADDSGVFPVAEPPRYHDPIFVSSPLLVKNAAFGPTLLTSLRMAPKYAYRSQ